MTAQDELLAIIFPGDPGWEEYRLRLLHRRAKRLSDAGWKFIKRKGPRGTYYDGYGPKGRRIMSEQNADERVALAQAIQHADDYR